VKAIPAALGANFIGRCCGAFLQVQRECDWPQRVDHADFALGGACCIPRDPQLVGKDELPFR
jgi:hypothetical protein